MPGRDVAAHIHCGSPFGPSLPADHHRNSPAADGHRGGGRPLRVPVPGASTGPKYHDISIDVNASGTVVQGKARCTEHVRKSEEKSSGLGIDLAVTGTHSPVVGGPVPAPSNPSLPGVDNLAAAVVAACRKRDADSLWKTMTPRFRSEVGDRAAQVRSAAGPDLRRLFGYKGRLANFDGLAYLRTTVKRDDRAMNACWHADEWKLSPALADSGGYVVPVERGGFVSGFGSRTTNVAGSSIRCRNGCRSARRERPSAVRNCSSRTRPLSS